MTLLLKRKRSPPRLSTHTASSDLVEPDLPHLFGGWNTFTPEEFFALDAIAGNSLAADRATPKSVRTALEGSDADNWVKALATELPGMKKHNLGLDGAAQGLKRLPYEGLLHLLADGVQGES